MKTSHSEKNLKLPVKFRERPKCPYCGGFKTKPVLVEDSIVYYHCNSCGNTFGIRKEEGWKRGLKYKEFDLPLIVKVGNAKIKLTRKFIERKLRDGENAAKTFGIPMFGFSWVRGNTLYADKVNATYNKQGNRYIVSVLLNGYPLYNSMFEKLEGEVVL